MANTIELYTVYDLETLVNLFTACFEDVKTGKKKHFVIHKSRNDFIPLMKFLRKLQRHNYWLVGFNCNQFDAQIIQYMINNYEIMKKWSGELIAEKIHDLAQKIIALQEGEEKFKNLIPEWNLSIPHIDVYKQCHFDGKQKRCSLKWLQFTMRFPNIESMPIEHDEFCNEEDIPLVLSYNYNDTGATKEFFKRKKFETDLRLKLSEEYNLNLVNASEPRMAREIFGKFLSEAMGVDYRELRERRTYRQKIFGKHLIFPYVKFKDPILQGVKDFFVGLEFNPYNFEENNYGLGKKVEKIFSWANLKEVSVGLGGIHACVKPGVYEANPNWLIEDIDATSYYPNLGIKNNLYPEHLSPTFCVVYEDLFKMRQKIPKESPVNYIFKIILNSSYGLSKETNNYFHDPKYTFSITVNGQLLLLMLAQRLREKVPGVMFYQLNTDGVTIGYKPEYKQVVEKVKKEWETLTNIGLENKFYKKMVIVDVNNYLAVDEKGKIKRKGLFGHSMNPEDKEVDYHKNPSALIVPKALEQYFVYGVPFEEYIYKCEDIFDFCIGVKIKRDFELWKHSFNKETREVEKERIRQQVVRYYVSHEPTSLKKRYKDFAKTPGRIVELEKGWTMTYYNRHEPKAIKDYNIDYRYYIRAARDIIQQVQPNVNQIKLFQ